MGTLEEEPHQKCSLSRHQDRLLQPVSGCRSWTHAAFTSHAPQNPDGMLSGQVNATPPRVALPAHLCPSLDGASLFIFSIMHFLFHQGEILIRWPRSNGASREPGVTTVRDEAGALLGAGVAPSSLELKDGLCSESAACGWAPDRTQHAWLDGKWKGYRLFCQLDLVLIMFKYLKVTKLQSAEIWHKGLSLRLSRFAEVRQQKRLNQTEQNQQRLLRCYSSH